MHILKALVAAIAVGLALLAAPTASIASEAFQAGEYTAEVKGQQTEEHVFTAEDSITIKCKVATLSGEIAEPKTELELTPSYSECTASGVAATIAVEGCKFRGDATRPI